METYAYQSSAATVFLFVAQNTLFMLMLIQRFSVAVLRKLIFELLRGRYIFPQIRSDYITSSLAHTDTRTHFSVNMLDKIYLYY